MRWTLRRTCGGLCASAILVAAVGCQTTERERLEEERRTLQTQWDNLHGGLRWNAPGGSRWDSHPETHEFTAEMNRVGARIAEIDQQLAR